MEIFADDVFYWQPDSGLQSRKGNVKVKMIVEQSSHQQLFKHHDTLKVDTKGKTEEHKAYSSESKVVSEEVSEKNRRFYSYWILLGCGVLLLFLSGVAIQIVRR